MACEDSSGVQILVWKSTGCQRFSDVSDAGQRDIVAALSGNGIGVRAA